MDYSDAVAAMFQPTPEGAVAPPTVDASLARRFRDAIEPIAMHAVWSKTTNERLAGLGLNFLSGYIWGRAAALGEPEAGVVVSSFAVFEPGMVEAIYGEGRSVCTRPDVLAARTESTIASLSGVLDGEDVVGIADLLQAAVSKADGTGRPLFSGLANQAWPGDPIGRLWHACELAREHRGDSHVAVCVARGLGPVEMNILTELWVGMPLGSYTATRGWSAEMIGATAEGLRTRGLLDGDQLSQKGRTLRDEIEASTDELEQPIISALGADVDKVIDRLNAWSEKCVAGAAFPPDIYKRAAG